MSSLFGTKRKLISRSENQVSWLQVVGFVLILAGIVYLAFRLLTGNLDKDDISAIFFDIMLGVAFAFPDMLKDDSKQVSTMRIVVFMLVNVICMLMLNIGWGKSSFKQIELDGYWMGIIGFLFGAKAAQSYFESKFATEALKNFASSAPDGEPLAKNLVQSTINANKNVLIQNHPQIKKLIPAYLYEENNRVPCIDIFVGPNGAKGRIPQYLEYQQPDGSKIKIKTRVITGYENVKPQIGRGHFLANDNTKNFLGTACCILQNGEEDHRYVLTCNHVMTGGRFEDIAKPKQKAVRFVFKDQYDEVGTWEHGKMTDTVDVAAIRIEKTERIEENDIDTSIYNVTEEDCSLTEVALKGAISKTKRAFVIHNDHSVEIDYSNKTIEMKGLITLSVDLDHRNFSAPTRKGDSGALVYHSQTRQPIGMVIGANSQFTFVCPFERVINAFPDLDLKLPTT